MAKKITQNSWPKTPSTKGKSERLNCAEEIEELEKFASADSSPIEASEDFKKILRDKLWKMFKNKYYIFFALSVFFFG